MSSVCLLTKLVAEVGCGLLPAVSHGQDRKTGQGQDRQDLMN